MNSDNKFPPRMILRQTNQGFIHAASSEYVFRQFPDEEIPYISFKECEHLVMLRERDTWKAAAELVEEPLKSAFLKQAGGGE